MDRILRVEIERSRVYWDYYRSMFVVFSLALMAGMISVSIIYTKGEVSLSFAAVSVALAAVCIIFLAAIMSLIIWRHENRHFDEILGDVSQEAAEEPPAHPLV